MEVRYSKEARKALLRSNKRLLLLEKIALLATDPDALRGNVIQLDWSTGMASARTGLADHLSSRG